MKKIMVLMTICMIALIAAGCSKEGNDDNKGALDESTENTEGSGTEKIIQDNSADISGLDETINDLDSGTEVIDNAIKDNNDIIEIGSNADATDEENASENSKADNNPENDAAGPIGNIKRIMTDEYTPDGYFLSAYGDFETKESLDDICKDIVGEDSTAEDFGCRKLETTKGCSPEKLNYRQNGAWKYRHSIHPNGASCYTASQGICTTLEYIEWVDCTA